jgi:hypothetical protein
LYSANSGSCVLAADAGSSFTVQLTSILPRHVYRSRTSVTQMNMPELLTSIVSRGKQVDMVSAAAFARSGTEMKDHKLITQPNKSMSVFTFPIH